jgi:hypothetical protein
VAILTVVTIFGAAGSSAFVTTAGSPLAIIQPQPNCNADIRPPRVELYKAWILQSTSGA